MSTQSVTSADSYAAIAEQVCKAGVQEAVAKKDIMHFSAQKLSLAGIGEVSEGLNPSVGASQHDQVYGDLACEAFGLGGVKTLLDTVTQGFDAGRHGKYKTFQDIGKENKQASIKTKPMGAKQDLACRSENVGAFNKNSGTGEMAGKQQMAGLNNKIQQTQALLKEAQLACGMGNQAKLVKGHDQYAALKGPGMSGPSLAMQPKGPSKDIASDVKDVVDDGTTSWA